MYGKDVCKDKWLYLNLDNKDIPQIKKILNTVDSININEFPINGKELIKIGADTKFLGLYLDVLKKEWFESGCLLSKSELIDKYKTIFDKK